MSFFNLNSNSNLFQIQKAQKDHDNVKDEKNKLERQNIIRHKYGIIPGPNSFNLFISSKLEEYFF